MQNKVEVIYVKVWRETLHPLKPLQKVQDKKQISFPSLRAAL